MRPLPPQAEELFGPNELVYNTATAFRVADLRGILDRCYQDFVDGSVESKRVIALCTNAMPDVDWSDEVALRMADRLLRGFPFSCCTFGSLELADRVPGSLWVKGQYDGTPHLLTCLGRTSSGSIVAGDVTGGQFQGPATYLGPIVEPWQVAEHDKLQAWQAALPDKPPAC